MSKAENLVLGLHKMVHRNPRQLDMQGLIAIGPFLGISRDGILEDSAYFTHIHESLRSSEGMQELENYYGSLNTNQRREIGREINKVRIK